jgi:hypothetical protein
VARITTKPARDPSGPAGAPRDALSHHPVLALQRSIGNHAVRQLLQRDRDDTATLAKVAKELTAAALVNDVAAAGIEPADFGFARQIRTGQKDGIKPGLNIVVNLGARGRTGFVAADGTYLGDTLPAATADLPRVAISIGKQAFDEGENTVRSTVRHELEHAMHAQLLLVVQRRWRESLSKTHKALPQSEAEARKQLYAFAASDKASPSGGKLTQFQLDLIHGDTEGGRALGSTELLAHLAGFMQIFETTPPANVTAVPAGLMPPAIEQLRGAAQHGWPAATDNVKTEARTRLVTHYKSLAPDKQLLLRHWLMFLRLRAVTAWPKGATTQEARVAGIVRDAFGGHMDFLDWMLAPIRDLVFTDTALPAPSTQTEVTGGTRPKPAATDSVGSGKVKIYTGIPFTPKGDPWKRPNGVSLRYEGSDASDVRWLQFIWRELVPDGAKGVSGTVSHQGQSYPLTTEPSEPSQIGWNTDTATYKSGPVGAFYEKDNATNRDRRSVEMFDEPSSPYDKDVASAFQGRASGGGVTGRAHLVEFLVKGRDVLYCAEIQYEYRYAAATDKPAGQPTLIGHGKASAIDPGARARLHEQFPQLDYLP